MGVSYKKHKILISSILFISGILLPAPGFCAELLPIEPPKKDQVYGQQAPPAQKFKVDSSVFTEFEKKVKALTPDERENLRQELQAKRDTSSNFDEYRYYQRLIDIMRK